MLAPTLPEGPLDDRTTLTAFAEKKLGDSKLVEAGPVSLFQSASQTVRCIVDQGFNWKYMS